MMTNRLRGVAATVALDALASCGGSTVADEPRAQPRVIGGRRRPGSCGRLGPFAGSGRRVRGGAGSWRVNADHRQTALTRLARPRDAWPERAQKRLPRVARRIPG